MEAKLIKDKHIDNFYYLMVGINTYATTHKESFRILSLKNCQAIERGYDLDTEVENIVKTIVPDDRGKDIWYGTSMAVGKQCFKKALEILGDKKFSEEDMKKAIYIAWEGGDLASTHIIESLQQTEWDCIVEMEKVKDETKIIGSVKGVKGSGHKITTYKSVPVLDEDGCLILKRKI
jgi:hypothetical protein